MSAIEQPEVVVSHADQPDVVVRLAGNPGPQGPKGEGVAAGGTTGQVLAKNSNSNYDTGWVNNAAVPTGGTTGQRLAKNSDTDYDSGWTTPHDFPAGGAVGDTLVKNTAADYDTKWAPAAVPAGGVSGQVLAKWGSGDGFTEWSNAGQPKGGATDAVLVKQGTGDYDSTWRAVGVPRGGTTGQILAKSTSADWATGWIAPPVVPPICQIEQIVAQSPAVATGVATALTFTSEIYDPDNMHDNVTNNSRITVPIAGYYRLSGGVCWAANATGRRGGVWALKGTAVGNYVLVPTTAANPCLVPASTMILQMAAGDWLELLAYQDSGAALATFVGSRSYSWASVQWIRA